MRTTTRKGRLPAVVILLAAALVPQHGWAQTKPADPGNEDCAICEAKKQFRQSVPWLELGADLRLRLYYMKNVKLDKHDEPSAESLWQRHRARVWTTLRPHPNVDLNVRLMGEPRYWCRPDSKESFTHCEAFLDLCNVQWRKAFDLPLTLTVGRQEFRFGDGWLIADGTPIDGGRSCFFDAARATWNLEDYRTTFDLIYIHDHADTAWFHRPINDQDLDIIEHDEKGAIFYVSNKSLKDHTLDAYFIYKHTDRVAKTGWNSDVYTFGLRAAGAFGPHWRYRAELAPQFGHKNGTDLCALGGNSEIAYQFQDAWKSYLRVQYEYRSGDRRSQDGAFDILWGRWPSYSNLYNCYVTTLESLMEAASNYHRVAVGWGCQPAKGWLFRVDYHLLFRDENTFAGKAGFSNDGCFRGQLITAFLDYQVNEHVRTHVMVDVFAPGSYYDDRRNDAALFVRYEIVFTW